MPRFLGLFSKKAKRTNDATSGTASDDHDSSVSISPTASSSAGWDKSVPPSPARSTLHPSAARTAHGERSNVYPSSASASSTSRLRLPFGKKRQQAQTPTAATSTTSVAGTNNVNSRPFHTAPRTSLADVDRNSLASDGELTEIRRLRPPPSKSAIFAAYADPQSALSTRSLPNDASQPFASLGSEQASAPSDTLGQPPEVSVSSSMPSTAAKKSFFSWTRSSALTTAAKSKSAPPSQVVQESKTDILTLNDLPDSSFNLKSFRHIGHSPSADSQAQTLDVPNASPVARPRGPSVGESSQRISVAAFREAQARRSMAGSPVPSPRSSGLFSPPSGPQEPGGASGRSSPRPAPGRSSIFESKNRSRSALASDSDAETSSAEEDSDEDGYHERTVTQRGVWSGKMKERAKSELGHGVSREESIERPQSSLGHHTRQRASVSTSAATPSAAAKRASVLANVNANDPAAEYKRHSRHIREASVYSNPGTSTASGFSTKQLPRPISPASDSSSDDDAPLATLIPPRRPGSSLSTASGSQNSNRSTSNQVPGRGKPLIDINEVIGGKAPTIPGRKEMLSEDKGFTKGSTLLSGSTSANVSPSSSESIPSISECSLSDCISPGSKVPASVSTSSFLAATPLTASPTESLGSSSFATATSSAKLPGQSSPSLTNVEQGPKRDGLSERLARAAKGTPVAVGSPSPLSTPLVSPRLSDTEARKRTALPTSPQPSFEAPNPMASRRSADLANLPASRNASPASIASRRQADVNFPPPRNASLASTRLPTTSNASPAPTASINRNVTPVSTSSTNTPPRVVPLKQLNPSPPDEDLVAMLGASVKLISRTGESSPEAFHTHDNSESDESDNSSDDDDTTRSSPHDDRTDEWEKVDPTEVKGKEEFMGKGKGVLGGRAKEKGKEKEANAEELVPKLTEPPIAPIPIRQRAPMPSFSVTSRPPLLRNGMATSNSGSGSASASGPTSGYTSSSVIPSSTSSGSLVSSSSSGTRTRQRSSTLLNPTTLDFPKSLSSSSSASGTTTGDAVRSRAAALSPPALRSPAMSRNSGVSGGSTKDANANPGPNRSSMLLEIPSVLPNGRPRSTTMLPSINVSQVSAVMPSRPFARRESPASSTGDSSSGRAPLTPRDGSDIGSTGGNTAMKGSSGMRNGKRRSICFEDDLRLSDAPAPSQSGKGKTTHKEGKDQTEEEKRKERRRSEAKAAIDLGNVINGRGPVVDSDDEDMPVNQTTQARASNMNPVMAMRSGMHPMQMGGMQGWNGSWGNPMGQQPIMNGPQYMFPPAPADPSLFAAHQQAMMIAKQAYQMAVAQQAVAAAGDEWERGSVASGFSGFGGGIPGRMPAPYGMGMNMNMNIPMMGMGMGSNWPPGGSGIFPPSARSMYGMSGARSDYGGVGGGGGGWSSSKSTYGESFGPPTGRIPKSAMTEREWRESGHFPPVPPLPPQTQGSPGSRGSAPRQRTTSQPASRTKKSPPSSWKGS